MKWIKKLGIFFTFFLLSQYICCQRVGLVLSGGGAKGIAHVGLIKALEDNNIPVDYISGTSIGAIVGGLYAIGYSADEMLELFCSEKFNLWMNGQVEEDYKYYFKKPEATPEFTRLKVSISDSSSIVSHILPKSFINPIQMNFAFMELFAAGTSLSNGNFNNLFVPFVCVSSDINNKKPIIFNSGDLGDAVRASMSFPFVFKSIKIDSTLLFDGGIYDNFPIRPMREYFDPDYVIGSVVTTKTEDSKVDENNLFDQLESMIMQTTRYRLRRQDNGILIRYELKGVGLLDFNKAKELFQIGYEQGLQYVDSIKQHVARELPKEELEVRRLLFKSKLPELVFSNIHINGVNNAQKDYIKNVIHYNERDFTLKEFKTAYFKLLSDSKISEIIPHAIYNAATKKFDLHLNVILDEDIVVSFGGNISSSNSNQAYMAIGYQMLNKYAINYDLEGNFGVAYNSVLLSGRIDLPTKKTPMYLRLMGVFSNHKFYNSDNLFYTEDVPAFVRQQEFYSKLRVGFPFMMRGKAEVSLGYGELRDYYYQSNNVSFGKTEFDNSNYKLAVGTFRIEHNSLNQKMYATEGSNWYMIAQLGVGRENFVSAPTQNEGGTTTTRENKDHSWLQIKTTLRDYNVVTPKFHYGFHLEGVVSGKNFFNNYTASVAQASAFTPTPHSKTVFNEKFRANQYFAAGIIPIWNYNRYFHIRPELYGFLPVNEIVRNTMNKAEYAKFSGNKIQYLGELSVVCQLPFMSIAVFANKYSYPKENWNFGLNIGYLIFNSKLIEQ